MDFYKKGGFLVENNEVILEKDGKPTTKKRPRSPMLFNTIYAIINMIIYVPLLLLGMFLWAFDGFTGNPTIGMLWLLLYGGIAIVNIAKGVFLLTRTKFGFVFNRVINSLYIGLFGGLFIFAALFAGGLVIFMFLGLIILSLYLWKKSKKKIYLMLTALFASIALFIIGGDLSIITFGMLFLFVLELLLLKYYNKNKNIFLGIIKREKVLLIDNMDNNTKNNIEEN
jgi:hypothetical protein